MADMKYVVIDDYGYTGDKDSKWCELSYGHYEKGDTKYADKFYIISKHMSKGEERTDKAFGMDRETAKAAYIELGKFLEKDEEE